MGQNDDRNDAELHEGDELVRTTIVGGQPRKRPTIRMSIRVGLERVLYLASRDKGFRAALLADRAKALESAGLELSAGETAVLASVDGGALETMVNNVRPESRKDHRFVKAVAATFVTLATGTTGCETTEGDVDVDPIRGITTEVVDLDASPEFSAGVDPGVLTDVSHDMPAAGGTFPDDVPSIDLDVTEPGGNHGILPDVYVETSVPEVGSYGITPDEDVPPGEGVEVEVANPFDGGSAADSGKAPYPRKPGK